MKTYLFITLICFFIFSCNTDNTTEDKQELAKRSYVEKQTVKVNVETVRRGTFSRELVSNGKLSAVQRATVLFRVSEYIISLKVSNGQRMLKGELLAELDAFKHKKMVLDSHDAFQKAKINLEDQLLGYGYALADSALITDDILKMAKLRSGYNQAKNNLINAERNLSFTKVKAPINGIVANLKAQANNSSTQFKYCCEMINDSMFYVNFSILEGEVSQVKKGQDIEISPFAFKNRKYKGIITSINPTVNSDGMITVQAKINNLEGMLLDGMNVKVLVKNQQPNCIIIPKSALLYRQNRKVAFVHEEGIAKWVYIEVGEENSTEVSIVGESLKEGQQVIVSNNLNLAHETPVVVNN